MSLSVAFVREMSVGSRSISNPELCAVFESVGLARAVSFRASGNIIFVENGRESDRVKRVRDGMKAAFGQAVPVFLRTSKQIRKIVTQRPFTDEQVRLSKGKLQVLLFATEPVKKAAAAVLSLSTDEDLLAWAGSELFWLPQKGVTKSELDLSALMSHAGAFAVRPAGLLQGLTRKLK